MKKYFKLFLIAILFSSLLYGQSEFDDQVDQINSEGMNLYYLEKTSWVASDILLSNFQEKYSQIDSYFSYANEGRFICVFVQNGNTAKTSIVMSFDSTFYYETAHIDTVGRELSLMEFDLLKMRNETMKVIEKRKKINYYENTNFNIIPIIKDNIKKVYVLTASKVQGRIIFGNDYILNFNKNNKLKKIEPLHKSILFFEKNDNISSATHTHLPEFNPFMTATDVCTLLLYGDVSKAWYNHLVISEKYVSIWNYNAKKFAVMQADVFFNKFNKIK